MSLANVTGLAGVANDLSTTSALFPLGTVAIIGNSPYTYARAATAQAAAATTNLTAGFLTTAGSTFTHDVAAPGVLINEYFWAKRVTSPL